MSKRNEIIYCDAGWMPIHFAFCPNKLAWDREMKRLRVSGTEYPGNENGYHNRFENEVGDAYSIVTIGAMMDKRPASQVINLLVHEGTHVWQRILEIIGEEEPSREFEAYAVANIARELIAAYEQTRRKLLR